MKKQLWRGHLNDFTQALGQQMFFWGRDVLYGSNLLLKYGFEKLPSAGLQGTSCYRKPWLKGFIELHGACAGFYDSSLSCPGFLFIRSDKRCYTHHLQSPVVPGRYDYECLKSGDVKELLEAGRKFAAWLVDYEQWVIHFCCDQHRQECFRMFNRLPTSRPWLSPDLALQWLCLFAEGSPTLERARVWFHKQPSRWPPSPSVHLPEVSRPRVLKMSPRLPVEDL